MYGGEYDNLEVFPYGKTYVWQLKDWPNWRFDANALAPLLHQISLAQGHITGRLRDLGFTLQDDNKVGALSEEIINTSQIEGEQLSAASVRSSVARRLGVDIGALAPADRKVEGVVEMILDATSNYQLPLTSERLFAWHQGLFPPNEGLAIFSDRLTVGAYRSDLDGPMQVISGPLNRPKVHYQAPPADSLGKHMQAFLTWANHEHRLHPLIKAGLAHLWFVTIHPFDDGNGRIARAIGDLFLARAEGRGQRFYSLSAELMRVRQEYYDILERTQSGTLGGLDANAWLTWWLAALGRAIANAEANLDVSLSRRKRLLAWADMPLNARQRKVLNRLLEGFEGKLNVSKWASLCACSTDTALRDLTELVGLGVLEKSASGGRSTSYSMITA